MHAAKLNWKGCSCEECINRKLHSIHQKIKLIAPYYMVMAEIYPEFKKKYERAMTVFKVEV